MTSIKGVATMLKRKETMSVKEFMNRKSRDVATIDKRMVIKVCVTVGVTVLSLTFGDVSFAAAGAVNGAVTAKVVHAFEPLVELVKALSYPISLVMMLGGGLFVMVGNSDRGFGMIQKAGLGYVLVQMLPLLMDLLVEIAKSL
jgi:hypothetical protein